MSIPVRISGIHGSYFRSVSYPEGGYNKTDQQCMPGYMLASMEILLMILLFEDFLFYKKDLLQGNICSLTGITRSRFSGYNLSLYCSGTPCGQEYFPV